MRILRLGLFLTAILIFFAPSHLHAQQGLYQPAYPGYGQGCENYSGTNYCTSAIASCQSFALYGDRNILNFQPSGNPVEPYTCDIYPPFTNSPIHLFCPTGYFQSASDPLGCALVPMSLKLIGPVGLINCNCPRPPDTNAARSYAIRTVDPPVSKVGQSAAADPVSVSTGNLFYATTDYTTAGQNSLSFSRYINSRGAGFNALGANWRTNFSQIIVTVTASQLIAIRPTGQTLTFNLVSGNWVSDTDVDIKLTKSGTTWTLTDENDTVETYSGSGNLQFLRTITARNGYLQTIGYGSSSDYPTTVTDSYGRVLTFTYNTTGNLASVATPDGTTITYGYTLTMSGYNLTSVTFPTSQTVSYVYGNSTLPNLLTGIIDENGNQYVTWTYDNFGRVLTNQLAGGNNLTTFTYNDSTGSRTVTNALGVTDTYTYTTLQGVPKLSQISRAATSTTAAATETFTYDSNGYLASQTDWNGNQTTYVNNSHGLPTTINEAVGSSVARTTTIAYDPTWVHLPSTITTPGVTIGYTYDTHGEQLTQTLTDTTTTTVPYSTNGQTRTTTNTWSGGLLASVKTPNSNTTSLGYSTSGALTSITDPLSHVTNVTSHTGGGLPLTIVDPNGVTTTLTYDGRQRPLTSVLATSAGNLTTSWTYYNNQDVKTTFPDGSTLTTQYDTAHRLISVVDSDGNAQSIGLDADSNPSVSYLLDSGSNVKYQRNYTSDALNRMLTNNSQTTGLSYSYTYDNNGNALTITDPLTRVTTRLFDALDRLYKSTDANSGITQLTFDSHDRPLTVTDPDSNVTTNVYDGFGDKIQEASPDRGTTVYHYDSDGNLTSKTDAASVVTNWTYDAEDRPLTTTYPADSAENVAFTYDQTGTPYGKGIGRLTSFTDAAGSVARSYDERGNMLTEKRTIGTSNYTTSYTYDGASRVATITYPSGTVVTNTRDAAGLITTVATKAPGYSSVNLASGITYEPFGPPTAITAFNGDAEAFTFDDDYRMTSLITTATNGAQHQAYTYDGNDNLKTTTDTVCTSCSATYGYDIINRLTSASGWFGSYAYTLSNNGNMLTNNEQGYAGTYSYTPGTNRISSILVSGTSYPVSYTATGNITGFTRIPGQATTLTYNKANQLASSTGAGIAASYGYNAFRQRVSKTDSGYSPTLYFYDQSGNIIEEVDGGTDYDYITLRNRPIGALIPSTNTLAFLHGDKLGSPQLATDASAKVSQSFTYTPYGGISTITQQTGAATITQNNRFPGQLFDPETLLNHNGFRDYSPALGRYPEADPVGLVGGTNPYSYADEKPLSLIDPYGLLANINLFPPGSVQQIGADNYPHDNNVFVIAGHGNPEEIAGLDADELASLVRSHIGKDYRPREPILILSCNVGVKDESHTLDAEESPLALTLAKKLGAEVDAPNNLIWIWANGTYIVAPADASGKHPDLLHPGSVVTFFPWTKR